MCIIRVTVLYNNQSDLFTELPVCVRQETPIAAPNISLMKDFKYMYRVVDILLWYSATKLLKQLSCTIYFIIYNFGVYVILLVQINNIINQLWF